MNDYIKIPYLTIDQPLGKYYVVVIGAKDLLSIATVDTRQKVDDEKGSYSGIQRMRSQSRVTEINEYIRSADAAFPNTFIISVGSNDAYICDENMLAIRKAKDVAHIIDGQHRLWSFIDNDAVCDY